MLTISNHFHFDVSDFHYLEDFSLPLFVVFGMCLFTFIPLLFIQSVVVGVAKGQGQQQDPTCEETAW